MVAGLSAILFALTLQLVFALHVRNVLIDAASHGARYGTLADRGPADAQERTRELIELGTQGAEPQSVRLAALGLDDAGYERWRLAHRQEPPKPTRIATIRFEGTELSNPQRFVDIVGHQYGRRVMVSHDLQK